MRISYHKNVLYPVRVDQDPTPAVTREHRWSGWPGAWCLDCGMGDPFEECLAEPGCVCCPGQTEPCKVVCPPCPCPGEGKFDPYRKKEDNA